MATVTYLAFDTVLYGNVLLRFSEGNTFEEYVRSVLTRIVYPFIGGDIPSSTRPFDWASVNPVMATWTTSLILVILFVPMALFSIWLPIAISILTGILVAHTVNFLLIGHFWALLKHFDIGHNSHEAFDRVLQQLTRAIRNEPSIQEAYVYGSVVRGEWSEHSDQDIRVIRRRGMFSALTSCWFVAKERSRALARKIPLDLYVLNDMKLLDRMREDESPIILKRL